MARRYAACDNMPKIDMNLSQSKKVGSVPYECTKTMASTTITADWKPNLRISSHGEVYLRSVYCLLFPDISFYPTEHDDFTELYILVLLYSALLVCPLFFALKLHYAT